MTMSEGTANEPSRDGLDGISLNKTITTSVYGTSVGTSISRGAESSSQYAEQTGDEDGLSVINDDESIFTHPRHGFEEEYNNEEYINMLEQVFYMYYADKRNFGLSRTKNKEKKYVIQDWRMRDRLKTVSAALFVCLNIGVDPPDIIKPNPAAKYECWIDPFSLPASKALEAIGKNLQQQYETLSMRTRYRHYLDPSIEETKKLCIGQRRNAKEERILFHYNGHGVPMPTPSGEIWVFNKNYTQYIPVSIYDLQSWLGAPCIYVYDCSAAGNIIINFNRFAEQRDREAAQVLKQGGASVSTPSHSNSIQLAACGPNEVLPMNPDLPADLFTSCLTTPIEISVRWYILQNRLPTKLTLDMVLKIPGRLQDRRTPLGELNWIFTAITDTIAWNTFPKHLFRRLFRQDLMVAALFRNFLLAQRIMRVHNCHPQSSPELPSTYNHPMWNSWDLAIDNCLSQLPALLDAESKGLPYEYVHSTFFSEQLTAFEVWLSQGVVTKKPPDQLPLVLQVLLSQVHRLRALILLSKFLDIGVWAVDLALSIGIFPYVLKLLQSPAIELKPVLVFIWARILAVDSSCQADLLKDNGYGYFVQILNPNASIFPSSNISEHRAMCAFILSVFCRGFPQGQLACLGPQVLGHCLAHLQSDDPLLRQWSCLCVSQLWDNYSEAKWSGIRDNAHRKLADILNDPVPEVRASAIMAFTTFLGFPEKTDEVVAVESYVTFASLSVLNDGSPLVRNELIIFLSHLVTCYKNCFVLASIESTLKEFGLQNKSEGLLDSQSVFYASWDAILCLAADPYIEIALAAQKIVDYVYTLACKSPAGSCFAKIIKEKLGSDKLSSHCFPCSHSDTRSLEADSMSKKSTASHKEPKIKRTFSLARSLRNMAFGIPSNDTGSIAETSSITEQSNNHETKHPPPANFDEAVYKASLKIPLQSRLFDVSREYFTEPQMRPNEDDEPGSICYNQRLWRRNRNERLIYRTRPLADVATNTSWNQQIPSIQNISKPVKLLLHQFENQLVTADDNNVIQVWDWYRTRRLNSFVNESSPSAQITDLKFINEDDVALLLIANSQGIIRLFRNYDQENVELVTAWRALSDLVPPSMPTYMLTSWQQNSGHLLVTGDARVIRIWDASRELAVCDIPARTSNRITSITSDLVGCNSLVAGFNDGVVRAYDKRLNPRDSMVQCWKEHRGRIVNVEMQSSGMRDLISGSANGQIKLWDIRYPKSLATSNGSNEHLVSLSTHHHAPVFASGTAAHSIKIWRMDRTSFRDTPTYLSQSKIGSITDMMFHPHHLLLACAESTDNRINFYTCTKNEIMDQLY
ncbi:WD repeat protein [Schizosaccharomyces japonicus yFS275]|uniref:WD repeat protein n=1 Tax=Schizosaccharomyces japonicus (strain yFS275 / FY16936) TaxID=402676 RepID=B6JY50_SCHJY|nr:WD repeat protein [Schizosaccharomyces japonicus yFS275]EEB06468.2 WD repeat protein [Schizosaccharomyces japonicus yFS275]